MPGDQREDDALSVCFDTVPLAEGMDLLGAASLRLTLTSDRPRAQLIARLCDVAPDGRSLRIAHGMLNLCHRDSREAPSEVPVGMPFEVELVLDQMAHRLAPGHRLRLALSTTYWPFLWPVADPATLTLTSGTLDLPRHEGSIADEWTFPPPHSAPPARRTVLGPSHSVRRVERDLIGGTVTMVVEENGGAVRIDSHGLITEESQSERWTIHPDDPAQARAEITWRQKLGRGDWSVRTEARSTMTADVESLHMKASLTAWEGDQEVFVRNWDEKVPRDWA
jgi:hypothetical protein